MITILYYNYWCLFIFIIPLTFIIPKIIWGMLLVQPVMVKYQFFHGAAGIDPLPYSKTKTVFHMA